MTVSTESESLTSEPTMKPIEIQGENRGEVVENGGEVDEKKLSLYSVVYIILTSIFFPGPGCSGSTTLFQRVKNSYDENGWKLRDAFGRAANDLVVWTKQGSALRALFVISVGSCTFLALTGFLIFMIFFVGATINAIIISLVVSLAAAGGFLAFFFACVTAIYIGALFVAVFVVASTTITTIIAILITTGWVGFFLILWLVTKKSASLAKHSLSYTESVISAYSAAR